MFSIKKLVAGVALAVAATGAYADINTGASGSDGELVLYAYDPGTNNTLIKDLGINFTTFINNLGNASYTINENLAADLASIGGGAFNFTTGATQWNVAAARVGATTGQTNNGLLSTINLADSPNVNFPSTTTFSGAFNSILVPLEGVVRDKAGYVNANSPTQGDHTANDTFLITDASSPAAFNNIWGNNFKGIINGIDTATTVGSSLYTYNWYRSGTTTATNVVNTVQAPGLWTLNSSGVLNYSVASAVPVPAAVWLLGSGLVGLGVIPRRKPQA